MMPIGRWRGTLFLAGVAVVLAIAAGANEPRRKAARLVEPRKIYSAEAMQPIERALFSFAYRFADLGDYPSAIESMQTAANRLVQRRNANFELWDNLAELYCVAAQTERSAKRAAALRESGLAMLAESRCAINFYERGEEGMSCFGGRGVVPNPAFAPLCFRVFCGDDPVDTLPREQVSDEDRSEENITQGQSVRLWHAMSYREDAENLNTIENVCKGRGR